MSLAIVIQNYAFRCAGLGFLMLAKMKNMLQGYRTPKPFSIHKYERCIDYDIHVVEGWLAQLAKYTGQDDFIFNKEILELGPGSDLGIGLCLLAKGAKCYHAIDANNLVKTVPDGFYEALLDRLRKFDAGCCIAPLTNQLKIMRQGYNGQIHYVWNEDFDIVASIGMRSIDIVFSQAAFEHFDDVQMTIRQVSEVVKPGAVFVAEVDLRSHARWIRDKDPVNIYRYPKRLYDLFSFRGSPNRVRPYQYEEALRAYGWQNISIQPLNKLDDKALAKVRPYLSSEFQDERNQMTYLTIMIIATKSPLSSISYTC